MVLKYLSQENNFLILQTNLKPSLKFNKFKFNYKRKFSIGLFVHL